MATKTQTGPTAFSRARFGFGPKHPRSRLPPEPPEDPNDADWYIPYNGPYELPPASPQSRHRDSWGPLLGSVLGNAGTAKSSEVGHERADRRTASGQITSAIPSSGAYSSHPYRRTAAPNQMGTPGPATGRSAMPQPLRGGRPSLLTTSSTPFAHIDSTGGVGESPTPVQRSSPLHASPPSNAYRLSLASFLTFGSSARKFRSDSVPAARQPSGKRPHTGNPTTPDHPLQSNRATIADRRLPRSRSPLHLGQTTERRARQRSHTLPIIITPLRIYFPRAEAPRRAPIVSPDKGKGVDRSYRYPRPPPPDTLNNSEVPSHLKPASRTSLFKTISTPNLRSFPRGLSAGKHTPSRGKYRWLSPETWCDALLFPRPRLMAYVDDEPPLQTFSHQHAPPRFSPGAHVPREGRAHNPIALRGSHSAVNLNAPNSELARGPPRAEPMLMALAQGNADGQTFPGRPRSFAQDDLALPSPVPSLGKVLEMGASFERERATWKAHAQRSLQSSKRTRSLGRLRSQSVGRARAQLKDAGGVGFLATKTLLGNQFAAPVVHTHTPSDTTTGQQTRSGTSHARTMSSGGISCAGSRRGRVALRAAATGLCISDDKMSPQDERVVDIIISRNDSHDKATRVDASAANDPSPSPPATNNSDVGVALSSPPPSVEGEFPAEVSKPVYVPNHPYAQTGHSASTSRRSHTRSSSDHAGPYPSAVSVVAPLAALTSDMSARHRLPPHVVLHPYASALAHPSTASQRSTTAPPILPKISQPFPEDAPQTLSAPQHPAKSGPQSSGARGTGRSAPHAYASGNRFSGEPLAFADALSYPRRGSADSGIGDSEDHYGAPTSAAQPYTPLPNLVLTSTPERRGLDPGHSSTFLSLRTSHTLSSSPPETLNPAVFTASVLSYSLHSGQASLVDEPLPGSHASSPRQSPRPFNNIEDLDRYRNLFYRPIASGSSRTPSSEHHRVLSRDTGSQTGADGSSVSHVSGGSGLTTLSRQLSNELEATQDIRHRDGSGGPPRMWGLRYGGLRGGDGTGSRTDPNAVLSITSESDINSPEATTLPLSLHRSLGHQSEGSLTIHIPQDVDSRTSSVLDRSDMEDAHHDGTYAQSVTGLHQVSNH
ncbi:hypothetical protein BC826DRAFT_1113310 [Russula brevipes]|nr:hypothetical protein BC826DRAFT_1113310 [Russula brevipes]